MFRRNKQATIAKHLSKKEFTILIGPRQIGKSTMLKQMHDDLQLKGESVYFLNLDRKDILDDLNLNSENIFKSCPLEIGSIIQILNFINENNYFFINF